jgi:hypothetical protein
MAPVFFMRAERALRDGGTRGRGEKLLTDETVADLHEVPAMTPVAGLDDEDVPSSSQGGEDELASPFRVEARHLSE